MSGLQGTSARPRSVVPGSQHHSRVIAVVMPSLKVEPRATHQVIRWHSGKEASKVDEKVMLPRKRVVEGTDARARQE